jgi:hypothetical protein
LANIQVMEKETGKKRWGDEMTNDWQPFVLLLGGLEAMEYQMYQYRCRIKQAHDEVFTQVKET